MWSLMLPLGREELFKELNELTQVGIGKTEGFILFMY